MIITRPQTTGKTPLLDQQRLECAVAIARQIERQLSRDLIVVDDQYVSSLDALLLLAVKLRLMALRAEMTNGGAQ